MVWNISPFIAIIPRFTLTWSGSPYHKHTMCIFTEPLSWTEFGTRSIFEQFDKFEFSFTLPRLVAFIIILLSHQRGYPWPSLATSPYRSSHLAGLHGCTPYPHRAAVCRFELVTLLLLGHVKGSIGVHHLWAHPYFFSSVLHVWFVSLG